jgi:integrase
MTRAKGEGSVGKYKKGWWARISLPNGKRKATYHQTQEQAIKSLVKMRADLQAGTLSHAPGVTLGQHLEGWLEHRKQDWRANTHAANITPVKHHIIPTIGKIKLDRLRPLDLENAFREMARRGANPPTVFYAYKTLKAALRQAVRWQMISSNPIDAVRTPKNEPMKRNALTGDEIHRFLNHDEVRYHALHPLCYLAFSTGLRRGELLGLRWSDMDLSRGRLTVNQQAIETTGTKVTLEPTKTKASIRTLPLAPATLEVLREQKIRVDYWRGLHGDDWSENDLVFPLENGKPRSPSGTSRLFTRLAKLAGFTGTVLHEARHSALSLLSAQTRDPRLVADFAGHTSATFTMNRYVHTDPARLDRAAIDLDGLKHLN